MEPNALVAWLEELGSALVLADAGDESSLRPILDLLGSLGAEAPEPIRTFADEARERIGAILAGEDEEGSERLVALARRLADLQDRLRRGDLAPRAPAEERRGGAATAPSNASDAAEPEPVERDQETVDLIGDFLQEGEEGLERADQLLVEAERGSPSRESVDALFRVFHSIKGVAGFLELDEVARLAHITETLLNQVRDGLRGLQGTTLDLVFDATAAMRKLFEEIRRGVATGTAFRPVAEVAPLMDRIQAAIEAGKAGAASPAPDTGAGATSPAAAAQGVPAEAAGPGASASPTATAASTGDSAADGEKTPGGDAAEPSPAPTPPAAVVARPVRIEARPAASAAAAAASTPIAANGSRSAEPAAKPAVPQAPSEPPAAMRPTAAPAATDGAAKGTAATSGPIAGGTAPANGAAASDGASPLGGPTNGAATAGRAAGRLRETVKVDLERVDRMVEMIGELIITESMVIHAPEIAGIQSMSLRNNLAQLGKISRDLQDLAMRMRMVPVQGVFQKMQRMVRDLSRKTGKSVALVLSGEGTEMDRSMVEQIEDPLVHMIRNSMDHGIESPEERIAAGKPPQGTIRLSAYHEGGSVVVEIADDGRGLDRAKILARAIQRGIVREGDHLTDSEIHALVFAPGFSTAEKVTEISGRGVGMDVVKRNIEAMRGRVMIHSKPGEGSSFKLVLPLTLAIIDGMLVSCGGERYIVPSLSIVESLRPTPDMLKTLGSRNELLDVRGEILPLFRLARLFHVEGAEEDPTRALVVVVESMGQKIGLLVDDVLTQQQVVIKPLGAGVGQADCFVGGAILSDGRVGLILNIDRICSLVTTRQHGAGRADRPAVEAR